MRLSAHPERRCVFTRRLTDEWGLTQGTIEPGCPWQNGLIERSHRTDNEELFDRQRFVDSEDRRYRHRLYEMDYNARRPHQALGMATPLEVYRAEYPLHALSRMLM
jgi:putative transposase